MNLIKQLSIFSMLFLPLASSYAEKVEAKKQYDFLIGDWQCEWVQYSNDEESGRYPCRWQGRYTMEGHMVQDDFQMFNKDHQLTFAGTTLRTYVPAKERWDLAFLAAGTGHWPNFHGKWHGNEMFIESKGEDAGGQYDAKIRFTDIKDDSFTWEMHKSYDQGKTWLKGGKILAKRLKHKA